MKNRRFNLGFTVMELLVVTAIIGLLAGAILFSVNESRELARDRTRQADLKQMQVAIELYKTQNGVYPEMGCNDPGDANNWAGSGPATESYLEDCDPNPYILNLSPDFIAVLPEDPNQEFDNDRGYIYARSADGMSYKLMAHRTVESMLIDSFADEFARCPRACGSCSDANGGIEASNNIYAIYSAGAECW